MLKPTTIGALIFGTSVACYVALVVSTVTLASYQTELQSSIGDAEANTATLESRYYAAVTHITSEDPAALGFVSPAHTDYAKGPDTPVLTAAF